ncbi:hypothetical protein JK364_24015 [Streptomyces sp. 110]|uniref:Uncharacterized protein n=1 Tax=Streptomyces endocoffeicus TaxID=2898945 RepID=A0ABS1PSN6_9ACTN|nr:hypothetical protein [Streptomyces endocoffeicus]MBL1115441.1 hypothetical protein [Streptomyces endocoffeicus]
MLMADRHRCSPRVGDADDSTDSTMGIQRGQCARARDVADVREAWWKRAAALHNEHAAR